MGEVRVRVKLTNAGDEALLRRGLSSADQVRVYEAAALVDTGAVRSVLPAHVAQRLGLAIRGQRVAEYADGRQEIVGVTEALIIDWEGRDTLEEALVLGDEVILGHTVLEKLDTRCHSVLEGPDHRSRSATFRRGRDRSNCHVRYRRVTETVLGIQFGIFLAIIAALLRR